AVQLDERVQVEEGADPRRGHDDQREARRPGGGLHDAPGEGCERPEEQLEPRPHEGHPQALGLLRKEPRIAHVTVERGLEVDEDEPHFLNPAAEVPASQAMGELVGSDDEEDDHVGERERLEAPQADDVARDLAPMSERDPDGQQDEENGRRHEIRREEWTCPACEPIEQASGVERAESVVEETASATSLMEDLAVSRRRSLQKPEPPEALQEL